MMIAKAQHNNVSSSSFIKGGKTWYYHSSQLDHHVQLQLVYIIKCHACASVTSCAHINRASCLKPAAPIDGKLLQRRRRLAGARGARPGCVGHLRRHDPRAVREASVGAALPLANLRWRRRRRRPEHPSRRPVNARRGRDLPRRGGGVPGVGLFPGSEPRRPPGAAAQRARGVAWLLPAARGGARALRELAGDVRGLRQPPRHRQGRPPGLGRLLLPPPPAAVAQEPRKVAFPPFLSTGDDGGVRRGGAAAVPEGDAAAFQWAGAGGRKTAGGVRQRGWRRGMPAGQLLPAVPAARADAGCGGALRPRRHDHAVGGRPRQGPAGEEPRRPVDHRRPRPRCLHCQRRRPDPGAEQRGIQERGAPGDGERGGGPAVYGFLLQPAKRPAHRAHGGAGGARPPGAVPGDDLRRVPRFHPATRFGRQGAASVPAGQSSRRRRRWRLQCCCRLVHLQLAATELAILYIYIYIYIHTRTYHRQRQLVSVSCAVHNHRCIER